MISDLRQVPLHLRLLARVKSNRDTYDPDSETVLMRCQKMFEVRLASWSMNTIDRPSTPRHAVGFLSRPTTVCDDEWQYNLSDVTNFRSRRRQGNSELILLGEGCGFPEQFQESLTCSSEYGCWSTSVLVRVRLSLNWASCATEHRGESPAEAVKLFTISMILDKFVQLLSYSVTTVTWKFMTESSVFHGQSWF